MRALLKGALGWAAQLFGKTIAIGDSNTGTVTIMGSTLIKLVGDVEVTGKLTVDGMTTLQDVAIQGTESGGGAADLQPVAAGAL
jgi:hypothetical protein